MNYVLYFLTIFVLIVFSWLIRRNAYDHHKGFYQTPPKQKSKK